MLAATEIEGELVLANPAGRIEPATRRPVDSFARTRCSAALLWLSRNTVRKHLENVYAKLGVCNRTAAVARLRELEGRRASL